LKSKDLTNIIKGGIVLWNIAIGNNFLTNYKSLQKPSKNEEIQLQILDT